MTDKTTQPADAPAALQDFTNCPEWGTGGQFVYDPVTQIRTRVDIPPAPTNEQTPIDHSGPAADGVPAEVESTTPSKKDRTRV